MRTNWLCIPVVLSPILFGAPHAGGQEKTFFDTVTPPPATPDKAPTGGAR